MKRLICLIMAIAVCCISSFAWTGESFIQDAQNYYELDPVRSLSLLPSSESAAVMSSEAFVASESADLSDNLLLSGVMPFADVLVARNYDVFSEYVDYEGYTLSSWDEPASYVPSGALFYWPYKTMDSVPADNSTFRFEVSSGVYFMNTPTVTFVYDLPGSSDTLELNIFLDSPVARVFSGENNNEFCIHILSSTDIYLNDVLVKSYVGSSCDEYFLYSSNDPVTSLKVVCTFGTEYQNTFPDDFAGPYSRLRFYSPFFDSSIQYSYLDGDVVLDGFNDQAQNDLNKHNEYESEWTGSMTSNFNQLSLTDFTFPDGLTSGFGLITGIFNDLWNGMGEYKILYVFPLTLGVVLLLIGRISKFGGGRSSSSKDKGDSSA